MPGPVVGPLLILQLSLGFLSLSSWYWARAALAARFGVNDLLEARSALRRCSARHLQCRPPAGLPVWRGAERVTGLARLLMGSRGGRHGLGGAVLSVWIRRRLGMIRPRRRQVRVHLETLYSRRSVRGWLGTLGRDCARW